MPLRAFGHLLIDCVKLPNLLPRLVNTPIVRYYVIGNRKSRLSTRLCGQDPTCLLNGFRVTIEQSLNLQLLVAIDHQNSVDELGKR